MNSLQPSAFNLAPPPTLQWQPVQIANFTAVAGRAYPCNTTSAAFTVTLPASPSAGNVITLTDYAGTFQTNALTINPNGLKINSTTDNRTLGIERESITLVYIDNIQGWLTTSFVNGDPYSPVFEYLVISGGGSGNVGKSSSFRGSGGGAGQIKTGTQRIVAATNFTLTIGAGGSAVANGSLDVDGNAGSNSSISASVMTTVTSAGGGGGLFNTGYGGTSGSGNLGGAPNGTSGSGGGAGNGAVGGNTSGTTGGNGGAGTSSSITGSSTFYAGGGGGTATSVAGSGGNGGGGNGSVASGAAGTAGTANSGGGGGGGDYARTNGQAGGSGYIVIAYSSSNANLASVGAGLTCNGSSGNTTPDTSSRPGYKVYKFTAGTGTISW